VVANAVGTQAAREKALEGWNMDASRHHLADILRDARALLALPGNDFAWSSWPDAAAALGELDRHIAAIETGPMPGRLDLAVLFAPTGPIQEISVSSGWGREFLDLAERFDAALQQTVS
jgi:hypothetical protein